MHTWQVMLLLASSMFLAGLMVYAWWHRATPGAVAFVCYCAFRLMRDLGTGFAVSTLDPAQRLFWIKFQLSWYIPAASAELCFGLEYANLGRFVHRRVIALLSLVPAVQFALNFTNYFSVWKCQMGMGPFENFSTRTQVGQFLFTYGVALSLSVPLVFIWLFIRSPLHRWPAGLCLSGQLLARTVYIVGSRHLGMPEMMAGLHPEFLPITALYAVALFRFRLFELLPLARQTILDQITEGIVVLDIEQRVIQLNPAAEKMLGISEAGARGKAALKLWPNHEELGDHMELSESFHCEKHVDSNGGRDYLIKHSPLTSHRGYLLGKLVMIHDVTEQKQANAHILEEQLALATLQERMRIARELHDDLGQVLAYMKLEAKAALNFLGKGKDDEADLRLRRLVTAAHESHAEVRDYIFETRNMATAASFSAAVKQSLAHYSESFRIATKLEISPQWRDELLPATTAFHLLRVVQESLTNTRKHAGAHRVDVSLFRSSGCVEVVVADDGCGFDISRMTRDCSQHFGLRIMRERAEEAGGTLDVYSEPGNGTRVTVHLSVGIEG